MAIPFEGNPLGYDIGGPKPSWSDFIAYVSCDLYKERAETGQTLSFYSVTSSDYKTYANVPCIDMTQNARQWVRLTEPTINQGNAMPRAYSVWVLMTDLNAHSRGLAIGSPATSCELASPNNNSNTLNIAAGGWGADTRTNTYITLGRWYHYVQQYFADGTLEVYLDGVRIAHLTGKSFNINSTVMALGWLTQDVSNTSYLRGYVSTARLWNRTLSEDEIAELAAERSPDGYPITASDLSFSLYQKNETYSISCSSVYIPAFEIIEGSLPSTISFNTSTGAFTGKGLTDDDHTYLLRVRITAEKSTPIIVNVTIHTYKTARISLNNATFDFITEAASSKSISYTSDETITEWSIDSGTLPTGVTFSNGTFTSDGTQSAAETQAVTIRAKSANNQTGATGTYSLKVVLNQLSIKTEPLIFCATVASTTRNIAYTTTNPVTPVWSMSGTLPNGITFDSVNGAFISDPSLIIADESTSVDVEIASSTGCSQTDTKSMVISALLAPTIPTSGLTFYDSFSSASCLTTPEIGQTLTSAGTTPTITTVDGIACAKFDGGGLYTTGVAYWATSSTKITMSVWSKRDLTYKDFVIMAGGKWSSLQAFEPCFSSHQMTSPQTFPWVNVSNGQYPNKDKAGLIVNDDKWRHYCFTYDRSVGASVKIYVDGVLTGEVPNVSYLNIQANLGFGNNFTSGNVFGRDAYRGGYIAAARVYDRALTLEEVIFLSMELSPTASS